MLVKGVPNLLRSRRHRLCVRITMLLSNNCRGRAGEQCCEIISESSKRETYISQLWVFLRCRVHPLCERKPWMSRCSFGKIVVIVLFAYIYLSFKGRYPQLKCVLLCSWNHVVDISVYLTIINIKGVHCCENQPTPWWKQFCDSIIGVFKKMQLHPFIKRMSKLVSVML